ncbi:MAG TPA: DUF2189 domain-containing protein [Woeseiaceae bacterium]|nr:DUF2189 domain-containing protein [Woeseiaceae bacterium]
MSGTSEAPAGRDGLPFVAPCRQLAPTAPFRWVRLAIDDLRRAWPQSLLYGTAMALIIAAVSVAAWRYGTHWLMLAMLSGFVFLAPLGCIGLYALSAQLERRQPPSLSRSLKAAFRRHLGNEMIFALVLLVIFFTWARAGMMVIAFTVPTTGTTAADLAGVLGVGSIIGALFAAITYSVSAFSLPMIMHRDVDTITAIVTSVNAVLRNKVAMLVWLSLIVVALLLGLLTAFVGLVVLLPVIGFAAWHGYLETIDATAFPRHAVGITAVPRRQT